jgi:hypothetical protein
MFNLDPFDFSGVLEEDISRQVGMLFWLNNAEANVVLPLYQEQ